MHAHAHVQNAHALVQAINVGVALPQWMFSKDKKVAPLMLLALVGGGILLPLIIASWCVHWAPMCASLSLLSCRVVHVMNPTRHPAPCCAILLPVIIASSVCYNPSCPVVQHVP